MGPVAVLLPQTLVRLRFFEAPYVMNNAFLSADPDSMYRAGSTAR